MKASLSGNALSDWDATGGNPYCNFTGVSCNSWGYVEMIDISGWSISGRFPSGICSYFPDLRVLRLGDNTLHGDFLHSIVNCSFLEELNLSFLYATGTYPDFSPMKSLRILDVSYNHFTGEFPMSVTNLSNLEQLELYYNYHLSGYIPEEFGNLTELVDLDISVNKLTGKIPESICRLPKLEVLQLYNNSLTGEIPSAIASSKTLRILSLYDNFLTGEVPRDLGHLSAIVVVDLSENRLSGPLPTDVCSGGKLLYFLVLNNMFSGVLPDSYAKCKSLLRFRLSHNRLEGSIPEGLLGLPRVSIIDLSYNNFSGPISNTIGTARNLSELFVQSNKISGGLVESFSGNPGLCVPVYVDSSDQSFPVCPRIYNRKRLNSIWAIGISVAVLTVGALLFLKRQFSKDRAVMQHDETMSSSFISYDVKSFHRISFDQREILAALIDKNIVGHGGSGIVYKIELSSGEVVAVKRLWSGKSKDSASEDQLLLDKELKAEVGTLGSVRHNNIVKLYCYFSSLNCSLLIYEYMPNGNLWDALHSGRIHLNWPTRHQIAVGVAQGLAYLHHDLLPPIIHRDIKSTNILLDVNYRPKVADFGIAKVLQARGGKDSTTTVIAGTYGYLAPDFGESKNIIYLVSTKVETKEGVMEVLDKRLSGSFRHEMIQVLRIAIRCTYKNPALRPTMNEVVQLLIEAGQNIVESTKSKEASDATKIKNQERKQNKRLRISYRGSYCFVAMDVQGEWENGTKLASPQIVSQVAPLIKGVLSILVEKTCNREQHVHSCTCGHVFSSLTQELLAGSLKEEEYDSWRQAFPPLYRGGESTKEQVLHHFSGRNSSGMT
ncbi:hypothetical protein DKX38_002610 [Salix brachista]|uniref:non-specific serine/threonine protein kinase n=1 Tax=Salix brachista TaxID=2182728 RepID=A0A5N5NP47_9ROSI|nr:hypothetical protein DKX38_002610 [Salix brachista]